MFENRFVKALYIILLLVLIIFITDKIKFVVKPLAAVLKIVIAPLLFGGFLYYLLRPVVRFFTPRVKFKEIGVVISFLLVIVIAVLTLYFGGSVIRSEINNLINIFTDYYDNLIQNKEASVMGKNLIQFLQEYNIEKRIIAFVDSMVNYIKNNIQEFLTAITNIGTILILIPLVLFYFLKDDEKIFRWIVGLFPEENQEKARHILKKIDDILGVYIGGQIIVALLLGALTYTGYLIIGLPNALILAIIAAIFNFIPFIGPIIGIIPAVFVALSTDVFLIIKVLIIMLVVQQLEGNVLRPKIQGDRLKIHPLVIIFMVIIFVIIFGFLGSLFAVPAYVILRIIFQEFGMKERIFN